MKRLWLCCALILAVSSFAAVDTVYVDEPHKPIPSKQETVKEEPVLTNSHFVFASWNLYGEAIGIGYENLFHPRFAAQVMFDYYYTTDIRESSCDGTKGSLYAVDLPIALKFYVMPYRGFFGKTKTIGVDGTVSEAYTSKMAVFVEAKAIPMLGSVYATRNASSYTDELKLDETEFALSWEVGLGYTLMGKHFFMMPSFFFRRYAVSPDWLTKIEYADDTRYRRSPATFKKQDFGLHFTVGYAF